MPRRRGRGSTLRRLSAKSCSAALNAREDASIPGNFYLSAGPILLCAGREEANSSSVLFCCRCSKKNKCSGSVVQRVRFPFAIYASSRPSPPSIFFLPRCSFMFSLRSRRCFIIITIKLLTAEEEGEGLSNFAPLRPAIS